MTPIIFISVPITKVNEDLNNPKEFFKYLNEANRLNKERSNYSFEKDKEIILEIRDIFKKNKA